MKPVYRHTIYMSTASGAANLAANLLFLPLGAAIWRQDYFLNKFKKLPRPTTKKLPRPEKPGEFATP